MRSPDLRNICIIAHVDHGKTTLVDFLLQQSGLFSQHEKQVERVMDSGDLEREKGITISAKNAAISVKGIKINLVDTPGHADFGGEVERIIGMVDGAILLVDAAEGPLPQTRFVLQKALQRGHKVILCINKVDRPEVRGDEGRRINEVIDKTFDLFVELGASDEQCEFTVLYACARQGWCTSERDDVTPILEGKKTATLEPMYDAIIKDFPGPFIGNADDGAALQITNLAWSDYVGQLAIGRLRAGKIVKNQTLFCHGIKPDGSPLKRRFTVTKLYTHSGLSRLEVDELAPGDVGLIAGCDDMHIGDTITQFETQSPVERIYVEPPTLKMLFSITTSPLSGREGEAIQSRKLKDRLLKECRTNVAVRFEEGESPDQFFILGRGELQFAILIETMRREGLEFMVGRPIVMMKEDEKGNTLEPIEIATLDFPEVYSGDVTAMFQERKGILVTYEAQPSDRVRLCFEIPSRGLLGIRSSYLTATKGEGLFSSELKGYDAYKGDMLARKNGTLISDRAGKTTDYALLSLEERGVLFIGAGVEVYEGMIVGECNRENDMNVNPVRPKKLTNIRTTASEGIIVLAGRKEMSLEQCIEWIDNDEWIECTPQNIRLRKKELSQAKRSVVRVSKKK